MKLSAVPLPLLVALGLASGCGRPTSAPPTASDPNAPRELCLSRPPCLSPPPEPPPPNPPPDAPPCLSRPPTPRICLSPELPPDDDGRCLSRPPPAKKKPPDKVRVYEFDGDICLSYHEPGVTQVPAPDPRDRGRICLSEQPDPTAALDLPARASAIERVLAAGILPDDVARRLRGEA